MSLGKFNFFEFEQVLDSKDLLNINLLGAISDELDSTLDDIRGDGVIAIDGTTAGWEVQDAMDNAKVDITAGTGYVQGQRLKSTATQEDLDLGGNGTYEVYVTTTASPQDYDNTEAAWPVTFSFASGDGDGSDVPGGALYLAYVTVSGGVVSSIEDKRVVIETDELIGTEGIDDTTTPSETDLHRVRDRLGMIANRIKALTGESSWTDPPATGLNDIRGLLTRDFGAHTHNGADGQGPNIPTDHVTFDSTGTFITASDVQTAIYDLDDRKLALVGGGTMVAPLILPNSPTASSYLANRQYAYDQANAAPNVTNVSYTNVLVGRTINQESEAIQIASATLNTVGGVVEISFPGWQSGWYERNATDVISLNQEMVFQYLVDDVEFQRVSCPVNRDTNWDLRILFRYPIVFDTTPGPNPETHTYKVKVWHQYESGLPGGGFVNITMSGTCVFVEYR